MIMTLPLLVYLCSSLLTRLPFKCCAQSRTCCFMNWKLLTSAHHACTSYLIRIKTLILPRNAFVDTITSFHEVC
ncbi:hypothetical protein B0H34DRAFT_36155 [Crassisporium funariophilum]|nr:hypothetical protein B0H34DRAFT_36155 [Crassisporium funariophilum]